MYKGGSENDRNLVTSVIAKKAFFAVLMAALVEKMRQRNCRRRCLSLPSPELGQKLAAKRFVAA